MPGWQALGLGFSQVPAGASPVGTLSLTLRLGVPIYMVDGTGRVWGQWVINESEEIRRVFEADGAPRPLDFTLKLLRYNKGIVSTLRRTLTT